MQRSSITKSFQLQSASIVKYFSYRKIHKNGGGGRIARTIKNYAKGMFYNMVTVHVRGPKKWLILGVSLTHLVESKDLFFSRHS